MLGERSPQRGLFEADNLYLDFGRDTFYGFLACHLRQTAEHRLARLVQLGIRQARYFGRRRTLFQLLMAATVANLTLVANKAEQKDSEDSPSLSLSSSILAFGKSVWSHFTHLEPYLASIGRKKAAFRLGF